MIMSVMSSHCGAVPQRPDAFRNCDAARTIAGSPNPGRRQSFAPFGAPPQPFLDRRGRKDHSGQERREHEIAAG
jgi:hypothetical protein